MKVLITKDEILNYFDWESFCEVVKDDFDVNKKNEFAITFQQAEKLGIIKNQNLQFQTIYKNKIMTDCYDCFEDALEDLNSYNSKHNLDKNCLSIEVLIDRDYNRKNGLKDTRITLEELCKDFLNDEYLKNNNKMNEIQSLIDQLNSVLKK